MRNYEKGAGNNKSVRGRNGVSRSPYSKRKVERHREENSLAGMIAGGIAGSAFGPVGIFVGGLIGVVVGDELTDRK